MQHAADNEPIRTIIDVFGIIYTHSDLVKTRKLFFYFPDAILHSNPCLAKPLVESLPIRNRNHSVVSLEGGDAGGRQGICSISGHKLCSGEESLREIKRIRVSENSGIVNRSFQTRCHMNYSLVSITDYLGFDSIVLLVVEVMNWIHFGLNCKDGVSPIHNRNTPRQIVFYVQQLSFITIWPTDPQFVGLQNR